MPPKPKLPKGRRNLIIFGAAGALLLLFLYIRRQQANAGAGADPQALNQAAQQAAQQQAQQDAALYGSNTPSTFADNGANSAALGDVVASGLTGVGQALTGLQDSITAATQQNPGGTPTPPPAPGPTNITITNSSTPTSPANPGPNKPVGQNAHTITTHPGGSFFKWWEATYHHNKPPATILDTDPRYKTWIKVAHSPKTGKPGTNSGGVGLK